MRPKLLILAASTALVATVSIASATPISPVTESFTSNTATLDTANPTGTLTLSAFNPTLGTLTSVEFVTSNTESLVTTIVALTVPLTVGKPTLVSSSATMTVTGPGALGLGATTLNTPGYTGVVSNIAPFVNVLPNSVTQTLSADVGAITNGLSVFETGPSYNLGLLLDSTTNGSVPSGVGFEGQQGSASVFTTVTYTYAAAIPPTGGPVPEPASLAVMGSGLIGLTALLRRRRTF